LVKSESKTPNIDHKQTQSTDSANAGDQVPHSRTFFKELLNSLAERRKNLLEQDSRGRTPLFDAAEKGDEEEVRRIIFCFRGTGLTPPRLSLISTKDHAGFTAADVAEQHGHAEIARLLRSEQGRMEYFE
jgi:ankyrin repeat protein